MNNIDLVTIGIGGVAGALMRFGIGQVVARYVSLAFPLATFLINLTGSLLLGFSAAHIAGLPLDQTIIERYGFQIGFVGTYTTHSTFIYESICLLENRDWKNFCLYIFGSTVVGLICCAIGYAYGI